MTRASPPARYCCAATVRSRNRPSGRHRRQPTPACPRSPVTRGCVRRPSRRRADRRRYGRRRSTRKSVMRPSGPRQAGWAGRPAGGVRCGGDAGDRASRVRGGLHDADRLQPARSRYCDPPRLRWNSAKSPYLVAWRVRTPLAQVDPASATKIIPETKSLFPPPPRLMNYSG